MRTPAISGSSAASRGYGSWLRNKETVVFHTMRDGKQIKLSDMSDRHLLNTISMMYRKAEAGVVVQYGGMSIGDNEPWCDEDIVHGAEALAEMETAAYEAEASRRGLKTP